MSEEGTHEHLVEVASTEVGAEGRRARIRLEQVMLIRSDAPTVWLDRWLITYQVWEADSEDAVINRFREPMNRMKHAFLEYERLTRYETDQTYYAIERRERQTPAQRRNDGETTGTPPTPH